METLGEDLLLLAVRPNGKLGATAKLRFGLSGSELVRLVAARRVDVAAYHHGGAARRSPLGAAVSRGFTWFGAPAACRPGSTCRDRSSFAVRLG
jgi:hypothetical protein